MNEGRKVKGAEDSTPQTQTHEETHEKLKAKVEVPALRIAVTIESLPDTGGGFQQAFSTVESLASSSAMRHQVIVFTPHKQTQRYLLERGIDAIRFRESGVRLLDRWSASLVGNALLRRVRRLGFRRLGRHFDALLDDHRIDLVLLNEYGDTAQRIGDHPFIITLWDVGHRDLPGLPESYENRNFEARERSLEVTLARAIAVIANSPSGARGISDFYHIDPRRIIQLPFQPATAVRRHASGKGLVTEKEVRKKFNLVSRYVFYPASFAPQKNHLYLLEGLVELERRYGIVLDAVFCGPGSSDTVERQTKHLGLSGRIHFLGVVPDEDIPALYEGAVGLVMPARLGPTNLPPIEAVTVGCPVIYADLPSFREQMGDAALYCDLHDPANLAVHLDALIRDKGLRERLRRNGFAMAAEIARVDYGKTLAPFLNDYAYYRRNWTWPEKP